MADVATGTGHFLQRFRDLPSQADSHPVLHGYDISSAMFPTPVPEGITLSLNDVKQVPSPEMQGIYDFVHVRMLVAAMTADEWPTVIKNVALLVKPGGWIQWTEIDAATSKYYRSGPESSAVAAERMAGIFRTALLSRFSHGWNTMDDDMRAAGLTNVTRDCVSSDRVAETRTAFTMNSLAAIFPFVQRINVMPPAEREKAEREAIAEVENGCYVQFDIYVTLGQKPLVG